MGKRLPLLTLAVLIVGAALWIALDLLRDRPGPGLVSPAPVPAGDRPGPPPTPLLEGSTGTETSAQVPPPGSQPGGARREVATPALAGTVVDRAGTPVGGARLVWTTLLDELAGGAPGPDDVDWERVEELTLSTESDPEGAFRFASTPPGADASPSVVWIIHPAHRLRPVLLDPGSRAWPPQVVVEAAPSTIVLVQDEGGSPVPAALVSQHLAVRADEPDPRLDRARRVFHHTVETSDDGTALLPQPDGHESVTASKDALRSPRWSGTFEERVVLVLRPTFWIEGTVLRESGEPVPPGHEVSVGLGTRYDVQWVSRLHVRPDGTFGPSECPLVPSELLVVHLLEGPYGAAYASRPPPDPGELVRVELVAGEGLPVAVLVVASAGAPVQDAQVTMWAGDYRQGWHSKGGTAPDGRVTLRAVRPDLVQFFVAKDGFASVWQAPQQLPNPQIEVHRFVLSPAATLSGVVLHDGRPVPDFQVVYWKDTPIDFTSRAFHDEEGRFELEGVPLGNVVILASSKDFAQGESQTLLVTHSGIDDVVIELPSCKMGRGTIVDGVTGLPIQDATIEVYTCSGPQIINPVGITAKTDASGSFELEGLKPVGNTGLRYDAEGYGTKWQSYSPPAGATVHMGRIPLYPLGEMTVTLHGLGDRSATQYSLWTTGYADLSLGPFPASGELVLPDFQVGWYRMNLVHPDGSVTQRELLPEECLEWHVDFHVGEGGSLVVDLLPSRGTPVPDEGKVLVWYKPDRGVREYVQREFRGSTAGTRVAFAGLPGGSAIVQVRSGGEPLCARRIQLDGTAVQHESIVLEGSLRRVRIVDPDGTPLPGTLVQLVHRGDDSGWSSDGHTDADGQAVLGPVAGRLFLVNLYHPDTGVHIAKPIELPEDGEELTEIELDAGDSIRVRYLDGEEPIAGVQVVLGHPDNWYTALRASSDATGLVEFEGLGRTTYALRTNQPRFWPAEHLVPSSRGGDVVTLQIRRRGDLVVTVASQGGLPIPGAELDLWSEEYETPARAWIEVGLIPGPLDRVTNGDGELPLRGLPNGDYRWQVEAPGFDPARGHVTVPPEETCTVRCILTPSSR